MSFGVNEVLWNAARSLVSNCALEEWMQAAKSIAGIEMLNFVQDANVSKVP